MSLTTVLSALGLGAALLAPAAAQIAPGSIASCRISARGISGSRSEEVAVTVVETATAYVCGSDQVDSAGAMAAAMEVANATAFAIASVTAQCFANGRASFRINGRSLAESEAVAIASSVASLLLESEACGTCSVATELFAEAYTEIAIRASAVAEANLAGDSTFDQPAVAIANAYAEQYVTATATAFASILANVQAGVGQGCSASALFAVGDLGSDGAVCGINIDAVDLSESNNAFAELFIDLEAGACEDAFNEQSINATVEAIATAQAVALAQISAGCVIVGDASVCAFAEADIKATSTATADAFGAVFINAISTCVPPTCQVDTTALVEAFDEVLTRASASAVAEQCSGDDSVFEIDVFQEELVERSLTAITTIIANVTVVDGTECDFNVDEILAAVVVGDEIREVSGTPKPDPVTPVVPPKPPVVPPTPPVVPPTPPDVPPTPSGGMSSMSGMSNVTPDTTVVPDTPTDTDPPVDPVPEIDPSLPTCFPKCVRNNRRCAGTSTRFPKNMPAFCCDPDFVCVRRNARFSQCRRRTARIPRSWSGVIEECNVP